MRGDEGHPRGPTMNLDLSLVCLACRIGDHNNCTQVYKKRGNGVACNCGHLISGTIGASY